MEGQQVNTQDHTVTCSNTEVLENGQPKPNADNKGWTLVLESMVDGVYTTTNGAKYERV